MPTYCLGASVRRADERRADGGEGDKGSAAGWRWQQQHWPGGTTGASGVIVALEPAFTGFTSAAEGTGDALAPAEELHERLDVGGEDVGRQVSDHKDR
jgi:hypothetical protein